jgi:hypothetical protein
MDVPICPRPMMVNCIVIQAPVSKNECATQPQKVRDTLYWTLAMLII